MCSSDLPDKSDDAILFPDFLPGYARHRRYGSIQGRQHHHDHFIGVQMAVVDIHGDFDEGDVVAVVDETTKERIAVGQVNFSSEEAKCVARKRTQSFDKILGESEERVVMIHRDDMAILNK